MKKDAFCRSLIVGLLPIAALQNGDPMKLVHSRTGYVVVEFKEGKPQFHDRFLKAELEDRGIAIPPFKRSEFQGKEAIFPDDPLFQKAFAEVYLPLCIADPAYKWEKN